MSYRHKYLREGKVRIPASLLARNSSAPATPSGLAKRDARGLCEGKVRIPAGLLAQKWRKR